MSSINAGNGLIYQTNPAQRQSSLYPPKGWTDSVVGYVAEARRWVSCVTRNRRRMGRPYPWVVHLNLNRELPAAEVKAMWPKVCRRLRDRGVVCLWVREANRLNKVHYHIIVKAPLCRQAVAQAIEESMPPRTEVRWQKRIEAIRDEWRLVNYVFKARIGGRRAGKYVPDLNARKRLLFHSSLGFRKVGVVGDFWEDGASKQSLWQEVQDEERRIAEGLRRPNVEEAARHVHQLIGGHIPLDRIRRSFGFFSESEGVRAWIDSLEEAQAGSG